jgi:hypothetical protein
MKPAPQQDYPVRAGREAWEHDTRRELYAGIFTLELNHTVQVTFLPDVSRYAPPWSDRLLPNDVDEVSTVDEARLATGLLANYLVTPNPALAGTGERFTLTSGDGSGSHSGVVFYVTPEEFARYRAELERYDDYDDGWDSDATVSQLRRYAVIRFVEREVVASPLLDPYDAMILGRS